MQSLETLDPYTVRYKHFDGQKLESCFYASDAYEARLMAIEFNAYIRNRPNCIDAVIREVRR
ncbi:hypothetical protein SynRS9909_02045 [Synechococcus sp. RS9909]|uniref:hypothetical protein n=1 Tax=unclassified Synechococcus TaxID=2626047 RepID=UPI000068F6BB|nr:MULTISPECIES: hypothetical protein [unclassified Synechococcus]EAQ69697.1 hypothetical protein RS9917_09686 [Synechococcus sp. RS9917]QNI80028.1 hypothetical protein SynRS9909_02045 [Synechococcus sp. RS9909]